MNGWRRILARVRELFTSRRVDRDFDDELQSHLALLTDEHIRRGLSPEEARRAARHDFGGAGGLDLTRERVKDRRGFRGLETLGQDVRYALRLLRKTPGFTAAAVITLALGLGVNTAIFSLVDAAMLRPLPYDSPDRLVSIWETLPSLPRSVVAPANLVDYEKRARSFAAITAFARIGRNLTGSGTPERLVGEQVTASYFAVLGIAPALGRGFVPDENTAGADDAVILTHGLWQGRFGGDARILERRITLDARSYRVVGVMPPEFQAPTDARFADPIAFLVPIVFPAELLANRQDHEVEVIGRLKPRLSVETARREMAAISIALGREFPVMATTSAALAPLGADQVRKVRTLLVVLLGAVALVLLMACVNVASLLVVRSTAGRREVAVRFALGATRGRIMAGLITQSLVLAGLGSVAGLALGVWTTRLLVSLAPATIPHLQAVVIDGRVLAFTTVLAIVTGLAFGVLPAWQVSKAKPADALRATTDRATGGGWVLRSRGALMVAELAISTLLLIGASLMVRSLVVLNRVEMGFDPAPVLAANISLPETRYATPAARLAFFQALEARVSTMPGVRSVAFANRFPLRGGWSSGLFIEPQSGPLPADADQEADFQAVSPGYFSTLGIRTVRGRLLEPADRIGAPAVAVVSESFGRVLLAGGDPIGRRFRRFPKAPSITIVGVVSDIRRDGKTAEVEPEVYLPAAQTDLYPARLSDFAVRSDGDPSRLAPAVLSAVWALDPDQPVTGVRSLADTHSLSLAERHFQTFLFLLFAGLALALAVVGVYSVIAYAVSQRTAEIGLRMALGADAARIQRWIIGQAAGLVAAGAAIGLASAWLLSRYIGSLLFAITPTDPMAYAGAAVVLALAAFGASYLAARRAVSIDPIVALR